MKHYLAKTEPTVYSIDDLERDRQTVDGVDEIGRAHV